MVEWLYRSAWLKALHPRTLNKIVLRGLLEHVWVLYSQYIVWHFFHIFLGRPLMHSTFPPCLNDPNGTIEPAARRMAIDGVSLREPLQRKVWKLSFHKRPQFMFICSQRCWLLLLKWSFKSCQILGSSELRAIPLTHTPFQHHTIFSSGSTA